ncbi:MAG: P-loop NTPase, partial [Erysipelotrichaceae bacterium]|nr:P-loop NTPase [Erysipelotrichaceae bacterium]
YFVCPNCGEKHYPFGDSHIEEVAEKYNIDTICRLPIDPAISKAVDSGLVEMVISEELNPIIDKIKAL